MPLEQSFCRFMLSSGEMLLVDDASVDPRFTNTRWCVAAR
jgi:hypothetical protein